jgi:4-amino-4-deoxy-L-arabinose transferase-like glycosyltransferase
MREHKLWTIIAAGVALRLIVTVATPGLPFDIHSAQLVRAVLSARPLHLYSTVNTGGGFHYPYPPGYLPLVFVIGRFADLFGGFSELIRLPPILADAALSWAVWWGLAGRVSPRARLLAAAGVSLGPVFIAVSGYSAQIDSVAILPAVLALLVWERAPSRRRAWAAGLLIGVAACVKTVPLLMLLALAPNARSWREAAVLVGCAVAAPLASLAPFLAADPSGVLALRHYTGVPGMGGLSLVLQPDLAQSWLTRVVAPSGLTEWLSVKHASLVNGVAIAGFAVYGFRARPDPRIAAPLLWLVILALGTGFFFQYLVWVLPFLLLAGQLRAALLLQAVVTVPMLIFYFGPWHADSIVYLYVAIMLLVWVGWILEAIFLARRASTV